MLSQDHAEHGKTFLCYFTGLLKGLLLLPIIVPWMLLSVFFINALSLSTWVNHGYFALRFTRLLGPNLKVLLGLLYPVALALWFVLTTAAALPMALFTALSYPGWFTLHAKRQTAWRWAYVWAGWRETLEVVAEQHSAYALACNVGFVHYCGTLRRQPWPTRYDIHPLAVASALCTAALGGALLATALAALGALKALPCAWRGLANQWQDREIWWRGAPLTGAWALSLLLLPPLILAAAPPAGALYALYATALCFGKVLEAGGQPMPGLISLLHSAQAFDAASTRYILQQDVPHVDYSAAAQPLSLPHAALGLLLICPAALLLTPLCLALPLALNLLPAALSAASWALHRLHSSLEGKRPGMAPLALLGLVLIPAAVPAGLALVLLAAMANGVVQGLAVTHATRSLTAGLQFLLGNIYMHEYAVHKFALVPRGSSAGAATVHWASFFPPQWGLYARPYMSTAEWDAGAGGARIPISVVGKPARYIPPGLRRPRLARALAAPPPQPAQLPWWLAALTASSSSEDGHYYSHLDGSSASGSGSASAVDEAACRAAAIAHSAFNDPTMPWLDMCGPAYDVPGVGITRMGMDGALAAPVPRKAPKGLALPAPAGVLQFVSHEPAALREVYGAHRLPAAYRAFALRQAGAAAAAAAAAAAGTAAGEGEAGVPPAARYASGLAAAAAAAARAADVLEAEMFARAFGSSAEAQAAAGAGAGAAGAAGTGAATAAATAAGAGAEGATGADKAAAGDSSAAQVYDLPSALDGGVSISGSGSGAAVAGAGGAGGAGASTLSAGARTLFVGRSGIPRGLQPIDDHSHLSAGALCCLCCMAPEDHVYEGEAGGGGRAGGGGEAVAVAVAAGGPASPSAAGGGSGGGGVLGGTVKGARGEILLTASSLAKQREIHSERRVRRGMGDAKLSASGAGAAGAAGAAAASGSGEEEGGGKWGMPPPILAPPPPTRFPGSAAAAAAGGTDPAGVSMEEGGGGAHATQQEQQVAAALALAADSLTLGSLATAAAASARTERAAAAARGGSGGASSGLGVDSVAVTVLGGGQQGQGQGHGEEAEEEEEDDEVFVLQPVVRPDLPDEWVAVPSGEGDTYFVNYARNQSTWRLPA